MSEKHEKAMVDVSTKTMSRIRNENHRFALVALSIPVQPPTGRRTLSAHSTSPRAKSRVDLIWDQRVEANVETTDPPAVDGEEEHLQQPRRRFYQDNPSICDFFCVCLQLWHGHESTSIPTDWDLLKNTKVHRIGVRHTSRTAKNSPLGLKNLDNWSLSCLLGTSNPKQKW